MLLVENDENSDSESKYKLLYLQAGGDISDEAANGVWRDLVVLPSGTDSTSSSPGSKEFLVAMRVSRRSIHSKKTIVESGIYKIPGVTIVSIE